MIATRHVALFAGPGGSCLGAHANGVRPLGIEWDDAACATRVAAGLPTLQADVAKLNPLHYGPIEGLIGTPPCQAFSMAGKGAGRDHVPAIVDCLRDLARGVDSRAEHNATCADDRAMLVVEPLRWALALKPRWIMLEQVPPVLPLWEVVGGHLRDVGYSVWTGVLSAETFGVPQTRRRAFLIASLDGVVQPPAPTHQAYKPGEPATGTPNTLMGPGLLPWVSMAEALGWEPVVSFRLARGEGISERYGERPDTPADVPAPVITSKSRTATWQPTHYDRRQQQGPRREDGSRDAVPLIPVERPAPTLGAQGLATGRDVWVHERPAPTIVGTRRSDTGMIVGRSLPEGEGRNVGGRNYEGERADDPQGGTAVRVTVREAAILQGFPPDYPWQGSRTAQFRQVGDSVPPAFAAAVIGAAMAPTVARRLDVAA